MNSHLLPLFISYRSSGEKLIKYQANSSCVIMSVILMTILFDKSLILQGEIWCWSPLGLKGLIQSTPFNPLSSNILNPLSPNIQVQILQSHLHTFPLRISWENLMKDPGIFSLVIILLSLITLSLGNVWIMLGEILCWSLLGLKG